MKRIALFAAAAAALLNLPQAQAAAVCYVQTQDALYQSLAFPYAAKADVDASRQAQAFGRFVAQQYGVKDEVYCRTSIHSVEHEDNNRYLSYLDKKVVNTSFRPQ